MNLRFVKRSLILLPILGMLMLLVSCSPASDSPASDSALTGDSVATGSEITNIVWQWERVTERASGETTTVPNPENYTLTFLDDGTFSGKADCNQISGTYSQESGFQLTLGPTTLAFCGEASLDQQFIDLLNNVVAGGPDGMGGFALETAAGEKRMEFSNGDSA